MAVEHPTHAALLRAAGGPRVRLLPEESTDARRFALLAVPNAILRNGPENDPGERDNLSEPTEGEPVWLLDRDPSGAWLVHAADGYIGYLDESSLRFIGAEAFAAALRSRTSPAAQERIAAVVAHAQSLSGAPYLWGGRTAEGIDCSGLMQVGFGAIGVNLPRDSDMQSNVGRLVATRWMRDGLITGDLLFFLHPRRGRIYHVALHLGDGRFIESADTGVRFRSLNPAHPGYDARRDRTFAWGRRVVE